MRFGPAVAMCLAAAACANNADHTAYVSFALGQPSFIQAREGDGAWQHPDLMTDGSFVVHGSYDFELVAVFDQGSGTFAAYELGATFDDASNWFYEPDAGAIDADHVGVATSAVCISVPLPGSVDVTGQMTQPGNVAMATDCAASPTGPWTYTLRVSPGMHDFAATSTSLVAVRHDVQIVGSAKMPTLDLTTEGAPLVSAPILISGLAGDAQVGSRVWLSTANDDLPITSSQGTLSPGTTISALTVPANLLRASDVQVLDVYSLGGAATQSARAQVTSSLPRIDLLPAPQVDINFASNVDVATWSGGLPDRVGYVDLDSNTVSGTKQHVTATARWIAQHVQNAVQFDTTAPGYDPAWSIDRSGTVYRTFSVRDDSSGVTYQTSVSR